MNKKQIGEIGERIAIGELAKYGIDVMLPMSDNLPFDLVVFYNNKFFKCQVKTSLNKPDKDYMAFSITTNDWYKHSIRHYTQNEVDVWILCDCQNIYLLRYDENNSTNVITIRKNPTKNKQEKKVKYSKDYIISQERIQKVFY